MIVLIALCFVLGCEGEGDYNEDSLGSFRYSEKFVSDHIDDFDNKFAKIENHSYQRCNQKLHHYATTARINICQNSEVINGNYLGKQ